MGTKKTDQGIASIAPIAVGVLLALYGLALWLMSDGEANPAVVLLVVVLGAAAAGYGFYSRGRAATSARDAAAEPRARA